MDLSLFNAILSMDSYNRGYNQGILLGDFDAQGQHIAGSDVDNDSLGTADIVQDSSILRDTSNNRLDIPASFYAVAYDVAGAGTIISYRGTDDLVLDALHGYGVSIGVPDVDQGVLAFGFYQALANGVDPRLASISVTGHSLGGGLAGLVGSVYGKDGKLFDNMPFELSANNTAATALISQSFDDVVYAGYNGGNPWAPTIVNNDPNGPIITHSLDGEFLAWARPVQQSYENQYQLPGNPNLSSYIPDGIDLHSVSALIVHMFSITEIGGATDWEAASPHFWPVMFDETFATNIGMDAIPSRLSAADNRLGIASIPIFVANVSSNYHWPEMW